MTTVPITTIDAGVAIRYSSAMPWIAASFLSLGLWTALGFAIWRFSI
jgi:hypothetical protein